MKQKKWEIVSKVPDKNKEIKEESIVQLLLQNRGLKTKKEIDSFLHADLNTISPKTVGLDQKALAKSLKRIQKAIEEKQQIVIFGDYDVDGITATAILWETLHARGATVIPYIPNRIEEGYGLSIKGIENLTVEVSNVALIITVDNGIVANEAVDFANKKGIDVIITDHHTTGAKLPNAFGIVHTTALCGAGVAYMLSQEISKQYEGIAYPNDHLSLVALATVADLVPLTGANRVFLRYGLVSLHQTTRPGLLALFKEAEIEKESIGVYEIGHMIAPRLNAMGRLASAMDSLRLLCTKDRLRAKVLADTLNRTNRERQTITQSAAIHAIEQFRLVKSRRLLFIAHEEYEEGIIGLVAGKLVEEYYLPAIVLSKGEKVSKASARSIAGFNIIEFIRSSSELLINAGGHPMAAGFTIETAKIAKLQKVLEKLAEEQISEELLQRILKIDCKIPLEMVTDKFYQTIQTLAPFGMGNPEPTFVSTVCLVEIKTVGKEKQHLKLKVTSGDRHSGKQSASRIKEGSWTSKDDKIFEAIAFGQGEKAETLQIGDTVQIVYTISENVWNGRKSIQLKVRDIK